MGSSRQIFLAFGILFLVAVASSPARGQPQQPRGKDFAVLYVPTVSNRPCSPMFFCKTNSGAKRGGSAKRRGQPFTPERQVEWCRRYATAVLGKKNAASELVLVWVDEGVDVKRLKTIATKLSKKLACDAPWPAKPRKKRTIRRGGGRGAKEAASAMSEPGGDDMASSMAMSVPNGAGVSISVPALPASSNSREVAMLDPGDEWTDPEDAANEGPDYSDGDNLTEADDIPESCELPAEDETESSE